MIRSLWRNPAPLACAAVILLGAALRLHHAADARTRTPDELVYTSQAGALIDRGIDGIRALSAEYLRDPERRLFPQPTRVGYTGMLAASMQLAGSRGELVGAWLSCIASIASLILAAIIGYRFFHPWVGVLTAVFLSVFPPELTIARRTWEEAAVNFLSLVLMYCACAIACRPERWRVYAWMAIAGGTLMMMKESAPTIYGLCLLWAGAALMLQRRWREAARLIGTAAAAAGLAIAIVAWSAGGVAIEQRIIAAWLSANASNPYALQYATGPGYQIVTGFWALSPVVTTLALGGLLLVLRHPGKLTRDSFNRAALAVFTILFGMLPVILPHWMNLRYVSVLNAPLCLLAALTAYQFWLWMRASLSQREVVPALTLACLALTLTAATDYARFRERFVEAETPDLAIGLVLDFPPQAAR